MSAYFQKEKELGRLIEAAAATKWLNLDQFVRLDREARVRAAHIQGACNVDVAADALVEESPITVPGMLSTGAAAGDPCTSRDTGHAATEGTRLDAE